MDTSWSRVCTFDYNELKKILLQRGVPNEYLDDADSWRCHRKSYKGSDRCIFHAEEKDPNEFLESFKKELERMEREDEVIDFNGFIFPVAIKLEVRVFGKPISFVGATFKGRAEFSGVIFQENADFTGVAFQYGVEFHMSQFHKNVSFNNAKLEKRGIFNLTEFKDIVYFIKAEFEEDVFFYGATFNEVFFIKCRFSSSIDIRNSTFNKWVTFIDVTFNGDVYFTDCRFNSLINFRYCAFNKQARFIAAEDNQGYLGFLSTIFREPKTIYIIGYPLSKVSFLLTNIEGIYLVPARTGNDEILDETLMRMVESEKAGGSDGGNPTDNTPKMIREFAKELESYLNPETVHAEYKLIRKCLEANRMFTEAADLFIKEMKLARKLLRKTNVFERLAHHIYEFVSRYGESVNRPIILAIATTLLASVLLLPYNPGIDGPIPLHLLLTKYLENLEAVSAVFFQVRSFKDFSFLAKAPIAIEILIRVLAIIIFGNLFVAVRRRLERH